MFLSCRVMHKNWQEFILCICVSNVITFQIQTQKLKTKRVHTDRQEGQPIRQEKQ